MPNVPTFFHTTHYIGLFIFFMKSIGTNGTLEQTHTHQWLQRFGFGTKKAHFDDKYFYTIASTPVFMEQITFIR